MSAGLVITPAMTPGQAGQIADRFDLRALRGGRAHFRGFLHAPLARA